MDTKKKIVALLPEGRLFDTIFSEAIAPAVPERNCLLTRLPSQFSTESRLGAICNQIESADVVIADLTGKNPNITYLLGYAHGIGRKVLLIAHHLEDFPFDLTRHRVIGYSGNCEFLRTELAHYFSGEIPSSDSERATVAREKFLSSFGDILAQHNYEHRGEIQLENPTTFVLLNQDMDLALVQDLARRARELGLRLKLM